MISIARLPILIVGLLSVACTANFPQVARATTSFRLHGNPSDAVVTIDEEMVGSIAVVAARGVALPEGTHQVTVRAPGYFPWDRLVEAKPAEQRTLDLVVELIKVPE